MTKIVDAEKVIDRLKRNRNFFIDAWKANGVENMPIVDKTRVDEINNCIAYITNAPMITLRLMKTEECAGHSIEYAMGWKACIEWIKNGGDLNEP